MKRLVFALLALIGLVALAYGIGALLPREYNATMRADYRASPGQLYETIANFYKEPAWRTAVDSVTPLEAVREIPRWQEHRSSGTTTWEATVTRPPTEYERTRADTVPSVGSWTFAIRSSGSERTSVTVTHHGEIDAPLDRFLSRFVFGLHAPVETYLEDLGAALGEEVEPSKVDE